MRGESSCMICELEENWVANSSRILSGGSTPKKSKVSCQISFPQHYKTSDKVLNSQLQYFFLLSKANDLHCRMFGL